MPSHNDKSRDSSPQSRRQFCKAVGTAAVASAVAPSLRTAMGMEDESLFPRLKTVGDRFTFALLADPQVNVEDAKNRIGRTTQRRMTEAVREINAMSEQPPFVVYDGDLVGSPTEGQVDNFLTRAKQLETLSILVHGNHDGHSPFDEFKAMQKEMNGTEAVTFSFDCGQWHFVALPCNFRDAEEEEATLAWLEEDLRLNRTRPTMVFEHYHLMPQGLTQLEWYSYAKPTRTRLLDILAEPGNVRYVFCGHVHNGLKATLKTAWTHRGINFLTAPTITASRNFGEELPGFEAGMDSGGEDSGGGYYLLIDIDGPKATVRGRLANVEKEFVFPDAFRPYQDEEPLWFKDITDYPASKRLVNGSFEDRLDGWMRPYRYLADQRPGFVWRTTSKVARDDGKSAYLFCREKGQPWAKDEMMELYQMVEVPQDALPVFSAHYLLDKASLNGGGYVRLCAYSGDTLRFLMLFHWGDGDRVSNMRMAQNSLHTATGVKVGADSLVLMGQRKEAMFWQLPEELDAWHDLSVAIPALYDKTQGQAGAYAAGQIDKLLVAVGVWSHPNPGSQSGAYFDEIDLQVPDASKATIDSTIDRQPLSTDASVFETDFGLKHVGKKK